LWRTPIFAVMQIGAQIVHGIDCAQQCGRFEVLRRQLFLFFIGDVDCHTLAFLLLEDGYFLPIPQKSKIIK
jgi:hypothetical protein